jgi:lysophosphatidylcholine acyltransferase / lyso-PAF acetyltransferase
LFYESLCHNSRSSLELINYTQPVYVWREDPDSRQNTIKEIKRRTTSPDGWQQILIFPEGTCSNRKGLITFKPGAFYPGVPVQPVCIRYPNRLDTLSWTWQGPGAYVFYFYTSQNKLSITNLIFKHVSLELLWLTMTQVYTYCELEFLPVYVPTEEEKCNPKLFASNVRDVMAK